MSQGNRVLVAQSQFSHVPVQDGMWLSLYDGIGCLALIAQKLHISPSKYLAVEINYKTREMARLINPHTDSFCGIDHSFANNVEEITEDHIKSLGKNTVSILFWKHF